MLSIPYSIKPYAVDAAAAQRTYQVKSIAISSLSAPFLSCTKANDKNAVEPG